MDGQQYVSALVERRVAPLKLIHQAFTAHSDLVTLNGRLAALGIPAKDLLLALSELTGHPVVERQRLAEPNPSGLEPALIRRLRDIGVVPLGVDVSGTLDLAAISVEALTAVSRMALPRHRLHVALEQDAIGAFHSLQRSMTAPMPMTSPEGTAEDGPRAAVGREVSVDTLSGGVQGTLDSLSILEVVKLLDRSHRAAEIQVTLPDNSAGELFVDKGEVTWARIAGFAGERAFYDMAARQAGRFAIFYGRRRAHGNLNRRVDALVAEAVARRARGEVTTAPQRAAQGPTTSEPPQPPIELAAASEPTAPGRKKPTAPAGPRPISFDGAVPGAQPRPLSLPDLVDLPSAPVAAAPTPARRSPRRRMIAGYEVYGELGRGAHGIVYRVRRPGSEEDLALKLIDAAGRDRKHFEMRVNRELKVQAELRHRNIVSVFDFGPAGDEYYLVTEYLPRGTLADALDEVGTLPTAIIARIASDLIWGLDHAHERAVVHRDLKPGNLLLADDGVVKIGDFGLAHTELDPNQSTAGAIVGTPVYMSPEQAMGVGRDHRCDLFTIGTLLYEMVAGDNPFTRQNDPLSLMAVVQVQRPLLLERAPQAQPLLHDTVELVQRPRPEDRPDTAAAVHATLQPLVSGSMRRYPDLMKKFAVDPAAACAEASADEARLEIKRARQMLGEGTAFVAPAALAIMRAARLQPEDAEARELLAMIEQRWSYRMGGPELQATRELAQRIAEEPRDADLARQVARLCQEEGKLEAARGALERVVLLAPDDKEARTELELLAGNDRRAPFLADL